VTVIPARPRCQTSAMQFVAGVHVVTKPELADALDSLPGEGVRLVRLPVGIQSAAGFFDAVTKVCPLNPPLERVADSWDALSDSMFGGLTDLDEARVVIAWDDPDVLAEGDPEASRIALAILSGLPDEVANPEFTAGLTKDLMVLLGAEQRSS